jgi:predicted esterase
MFIKQDMKTKRFILNKLCLLCAACFTVTAGGHAQAGSAAVSNPLPQGFSARYDSREYFDHIYRSAAMLFHFKGTGREAFESWKRSFLPRLKEAIGLDKIERQWPGYIPRAEKKDAEETADFIRERWIIWTEPDVPLPMVLLIPRHIKGKLPLVITPHGHGRNTESYAGIYADAQERKKTEENDGDIAIQAVREGYIAIAPTTRAFGETRTEADKQQGLSFSCHTQLMHDLLVGRTPIADRVWDMSRIIDWALQNLPVDPDRIAVTGQSGGGTVTLFTAVFDPRVAVAVPSGSFCSFTGSIGVIAHCDCNYIPGILDLGEMSDVAGLIAPRPLCVINGKEDPIFPIAETRRSFEQLKAIYAAAGASGRLSRYEGNGEHRYYKAGSWPFIKKYFAGPADRSVSNRQALPRSQENDPFLMAGK